MVRQARHARTGQRRDLALPDQNDPDQAGRPGPLRPCLLYTSDAADERSSVDLGGRRIIKKKTKEECQEMQCM